MTKPPFSSRTQYIGLLLILFMTPLSGATIDIYTPSIPSIMHHFLTTSTLAQITVPAYIFGYAAGQLFVGTSTDVYGRKYIAIGTTVLFALVSALAPFSPNIGFLIFLRFLQGVFVNGATTVNKSLLSDLFEQERRMKYANYITISWAMAPIIAPYIGGYLQVYFGWHAPFYFLAIYGALIVLFYLFLVPETNLNRIPLDTKLIANNYKSLVTHTQFIACTFCLGLVYAFITVFNVIGPFLIQKELHYSPVFFGKVALLMGVAWLMGNILNRLLIKYIRFKYLGTAATILIVTTAIIATIFSMIVGVDLYMIIVPTLIIFISGGTIFTNCLGKCLSLFPHIAGSAAAMMGVIFLTISASISFIASFFKADSAVPFAVIYLTLAILLAITLPFVFRQTKQH